VRIEALVLGIGNLLWADEGFGVRAVAALHEGYRFPDAVVLMDGGTQGVYLLPYVEAARRLLVLDAIDCGLEPGSLRVLRGDEITTTLGVGKMSLHQAGLVEVLALAALSGRAPEEIVVVGVQPVELADFGGSLSEPVRKRVPEAVAAALSFLAAWGCAGVAREGAPDEPLQAPSLALDAYESGRPAETEVCRSGDARFLALRGAGSG
jgi:hydrogenase maturation protease